MRLGKWLLVLGSVHAFLNLGMTGEIPYRPTAVRGGQPGQEIAQPGRGYAMEGHPVKREGIGLALEVSRVSRSHQYRGCRRGERRGAAHVAEYGHEQQRPGSILSNRP